MFMFGDTDATNPLSAKSELPPEVATVAQVVGIALAQRANTPEEIDAKIANLTAMKRTFPMLSTYYDNQIRKLKARRSALVKSDAHTAQWRGLGQVAVGTSILFGAALTVYVLSEAGRRSRRR